MRHELQFQCEETKGHIGFRISLQLGPLRLLTVKEKKKEKDFFHNIQQHVLTKLLHLKAKTKFAIMGYNLY